MNSINLFRKDSMCRSTPNAKTIVAGSNFENNASVLVFAGLLIACSFAVGCSSEKPKTENSTSQAPIAQVTPPAPISTSAPATTAAMEAKPVHKKIVRRTPVTVKYEDKTSGVSFQYPRKYVLKTGDSADQLVSSGFVPMDFAQPGGVVMATVQIPEGGYPKSDLVAALFDVSMNKSITAEQCGLFLTSPSDADKTSNAATSGPTSTSSDNTATPKLILGDMELQSAETSGSTENRKEDSKYYHVYENGACYEFALRVATTGAEPDEGGKAVDREEVFKELEGILATVKINSIEMPKEAASAPATTSASPAQ
jgi:hypothetical protein